MTSKQQTDFYDALMDPYLPPIDSVTTYGGVSIEKRFAIYRNNVFVGMIENLESIYTLTKTLVETERFSTLLKLFIRIHPPCHPIMILYGHEFPDFLAKHSDIHPFIIDIARMEWYIRQAMHAKDATTLTVEKLQTYSSEQQLRMRFQLHPSVYILSSRWNMFLYSDYTEFPADFLKTLPKETLANYHIVITRPHLDVKLLKLENDEQAFLSALSEQLTFAQAYEKTIANYTEFNLVNTLSLLINKGIFCNISIEKP